MHNGSMHNSNYVMCLLYIIIVLQSQCRGLCVLNGKVNHPVEVVYFYVGQLKRPLKKYSSGGPVPRRQVYIGRRCKGILIRDTRVLSDLCSLFTKMGRIPQY